MPETSPKRRGQIWIAHLGPRSGRVPGKTRPVLLVQAQALLDADHPSTQVVPLTTNLVDGAEPLRLRVPATGDLAQESDLLIDHVRSVDNRRLVRGPIATLPDDLMLEVGRALLEVLQVDRDVLTG